jgi:ribosomal protein L22
MSAEKPTDEQPPEGEQQVKPNAKAKKPAAAEKPAPAEKQAAAEESAAEESAAKEPAAEKSPADKPATKKSTTKKPTTKAVAEDESAAAEKEPAAKKPTPKKPAAKKPVAEKTTVAEGKESDAAKAEKPSATEAEKPVDIEEKPAGEKAGVAVAASEARSAAPAPRRKVVRAQARYVRTSARKARMVCGHLRGKSVDEARAILAFTPREVARDWSKLLESAVANAENNHELIEDDLLIREAYADEGPTIKRFQPRAQGRATPIRKRTSHLTITLTPKP